MIAACRVLGCFMTLLEYLNRVTVSSILIPMSSQIGVSLTYGARPRSYVRRRTHIQPASSRKSRGVSDFWADSTQYDFSLIFAANQLRRSSSSIFSQLPGIPLHTRWPTFFATFHKANSPPFRAPRQMSGSPAIQDLDHQVRWITTLQEKHFEGWLKMFL